FAGGPLEVRLQLRGTRGGARALLIHGTREPQLQRSIARTPAAERMPRRVLLQSRAQLGEPLTLTVQRAAGAAAKALRQIIEPLHLLLQAYAGMLAAEAAADRLEPGTNGTQLAPHPGLHALCRARECLEAGMAVRHHHLGGGRRGRRARICDEVGDGEVD